jgi:cell volume regulation protein A
MAAHWRRPQLLNFPLPLAVMLPPAHGHLEGTVLPRGFFLGLGLVYLLALGCDRLAERGRLPGAVPILLLGLLIPSAFIRSHHLGPLQLESLHRISLALLIFHAGLRTDLRHLSGLKAAGIRLGTVGMLITVALAGLALLLLAPLLPDALPPAAAWLAVCCLGATDSGTLEDLIVALPHALGGRLRHLLQFETALSTVTSLLCFGFLAGLLQAHGHSDHQDLHAVLHNSVPAQLGGVLRQLLAGAAAGLAVGLMAPRLIDSLVRSDAQLLLVAVALAFETYGLGQMLGGSGLLAVFVAGVLLSNSRYRVDRFEQQTLSRVMHPFNTAAEITVLLLLGLLVEPAELNAVLPAGLVLALLLPLARLVAVWTVLPASSFSRRDRLVVAGGGLRAAVPLALAVAMSEELPHLRGVPPALAETLGTHLLALIFVVVLGDLLLQTLLMRWLVPPSAESGSPR